MTCDLMNWERPLGGEVSRLTAEHRWVVVICPYRQKLQLCNVAVSQNSVGEGTGTSDKWPGSGVTTFFWESGMWEIS